LVSGPKGRIRFRIIENRVLRRGKSKNAENCRIRKFVIF
jgi:hypothetical protein